MSSSAIRRAAPAAPANANVATAQVLALASNPLLPCTLSVPGKLALEARRFTVRAEGNALVGAGAITVNITLLGATSIPANPLTAASWTTIGAGTAAAIATATSAPWWINADLIYDSVGGALQGTYTEFANNALKAVAAITNQLTGINGTNLPVVQPGPVTVQPADPIAFFAVAVTFGTANAGNIANLANFEIGF